MKILLISHNCFSTHQSMGKTFLSLFSAFDKNELCQLYIYPTLPDVDVCRSYYRITDGEALRGIVSRRAVGGEIDKGRINPGEHSLYENETDRSVYQNRRNTRASRRLLRDMMWKLSGWDNRRLRAWMEKEKPTAIFLAPGYAKFIYDIALKLGKRYRLPIITYVCDDYYFVQKPKDLMGRLQLASLKKKMNTAMRSTKHLVTISQEAKERYGENFGIPTTVIMTGASQAIATAPVERSDYTTICYFGNLSCNRHVSLGEIGRALDELNREKGSAYRLLIYTADRTPEKMELLSSAKSVTVMDFVSGEAFQRAFSKAHFLLHTEAFDEASADLVKDSISTKIADGVASGIPMIAYGPASVASIAHLVRNDCAFVACDPENLQAVLRSAFDNEAERQRIVQNALHTAARYHDTQNNGACLRNIIESACR